MEQTKIISLVGDKCGEIAYFLAKLLSTDGEPVLCNDISEDNELFDSLERLEGMKEVNIRNITFVKNIEFNSEVTDMFKYTVVYHGRRPYGSWYEVSDQRFIKITPEPYVNKLLAHDLKELPHDNLTVFFTDRFTEKVKDEYLLEEAGFTHEEIELLADSMLELPFDMDDKAMRYNFLYNGIQKVSAATKEMKNFLEAMYNLCLIKEEEGENAPKKSKKQKKEQKNKARKFSDILAQAK